MILRPSRQHTTRKFFADITSTLCPRRSFASSSRTSLQHIADSEYDLFNYTSGRWIYNESQRLAERRLPFNVHELVKAAAKSIGQQEYDVKSFRKLAEGGFNRIFEVVMKDGTSILARLPYPSTLPRRLAVASEVATMDFIRGYGLPTPRVLGYAINENPVGSEYILMEKVPGRPIGDEWFELSEKQRLQVLHDVIKLEAKLSDISLPASGSIYYTGDLDSNTAKVDISGADGRFCIGPHAGLRWWFRERESLSLDRGPHVDTLRTLQAPAEKELAWIRQCGRQRYPIHRQHREALQYEKQNPEVHAASLQKYLQITCYLIPANPDLHVPILRHPDIQPNNIFISDDYRVTGLIDWQYAVALPTFLAAGIPNLFQNYADPESRYFSPPGLPAEFASLADSERAQAEEDFRRRQVHFMYLGFTQRLNPRHWRALEQPTDILTRRVFDHAGEPWEGFNTPLQYDLVDIQRNWDKFLRHTDNATAPSCPLSFTPDEAKRIDALDDLHRDADADFEQVSGYLGVGSDGWTTHERFGEAKRRAGEVREQGLASADGDPWLRVMSERHWPFDDWDEDE